MPAFGILRRNLLHECECFTNWVWERADSGDIKDSIEERERHRVVTWRTEYPVVSQEMANELSD
ncbi:hypothetical protein DBV15_01487 [Temnothorax longispinosus]|uniref:Uncharacterized protein n=1 Tax=Temnothorax longispinosus TaxID=300112 RepID=A0A4S2KYU6_9HYME|nr:hypothetical protein DBV15_01487 [Temnothorax longispinosus]